jgi:hypothetical protein
MFLRHRHQTLGMGVEKKMYLLSKYSFTLGSPLEEYMEKKRCKLPSVFTLFQILESLKNIIWKETLYDENNVGIVMCDKDLEKALNVKALHMQNIPAYVKRHLMLIDGYPLPSQAPKKAVKQVKKHTKKEKPSWMICDGMREVFATLPHFPKHKKYFKMEDLVQYLSAYMLANSKRLIDPRNIHIAIVEKDKIGHVFGVRAFHVSQAVRLFKCHVTKKPAVVAVDEQIAPGQRRKK